MGGVDLYDQKLRNHSYEHRCHRWTHVIWHLVRQVVLNNSYIIYCSAFSDTKFQSKDFKLSIAYSLLRADQNVLLIRGTCLTARLVWIDMNRKRKRKDCAVCKESKRRRQVTHHCSACFLPLCSIATTRRETCFQKHLTH